MIVFQDKKKGYVEFDDGCLYTVFAMQEWGHTPFRKVNAGTVSSLEEAKNLLNFSFREYIAP